MGNVNKKHVSSIYVGTNDNMVSIVCTGCDSTIQITKDDILDKKKLIPHVKCPICSLTKKALFTQPPQRPLLKRNCV